MKKFLLLLFVLVGVLIAVFWYANTELQNFLSAGLQAETIRRNANDISETNVSVDGWQFAVIGDTEGLSPITQQMIENMAEQKEIEFVVHLGDLDDAPPEKQNIQAVMDAFSVLPVPTYYIPGNNDLIYDETIERKTRALYNEVVNENDYYAIEHNNAHLLLLDNSYRRDGFPEEELTWLQTELDRDVGDYTFLFYHRPIAVPGESLFGDDETPDSREQNDKFRELIADYSITHIFNGHLHTTFNYELDGIAVTVSGGGGAEAQSIFKNTGGELFHYYIVTVPYDSEEQPVLELISFE